MSQPTPESIPDVDERLEAYEAWRDLQDVLEERDREWWAEAQDDEDE